MTARQYFRLGLAISLCVLFFTTRGFGEAQDTLSQYVQSLQEQVLEEGRITGELTEEDLASLPMGVGKEINGKRYYILVDEARYTPQGAFINAYLSLPLPISKTPIIFKATNIAFQPGGIANSSSMKLVLASRQEKEVNTQVTLVLPAEGDRNYVEWDCNGFKAVNLKGQLLFSESLLVSEDKEEPQVKGTFEINTGDPGSIITAISISPFQVKSLEGFTFEVEEAILDYSDIANPTNIVFPKDYPIDETLPLLWEGFYLKKLQVTLPSSIMTKEGRAKISAENLIIDELGVSGIFTASGIFGNDKGTLDGWPMSMDSLSVTLLKGSLSGAGFKGDLTLPLFAQPVSYEALIYTENNQTNYLFSVQTGKSFSAPVLGAEITLDPTSYIKITKKEGRFRPEAILNGKATVESGAVNFKALQFQNLHLATEKPYVRSGVWSLAGDEQKVAAFPVSIQNLVVVHDEQQIKLNADVVLSLMDENDKGFGASTNVTVRGELEEEEIQIEEETVTEQHWTYAGTTVNDIEINIKGGGYALEGRLSLYDHDEVYGSGFRGQVQATFEPNIQVEATAQFGSVNGNRYWYADAKAMLPKPVGTGFAIYGFGGGMYYHMGIQQFDQVTLSDAQATGQEALQVGKTQSGIIFVPDSSIGLGLRATVIVGTTPSAAVFNGDATFEMAFNSSGGLRYIGFSGEGYFMTPMKQRSREAPIYAELLMLYDFNNKTFHATLDTYVNAYGLIKGIHENGLAGSAVIHFAPDEWYIHIGTPDQRIGLEFVGLVETGSYFMVGTNIPGMPTPPSEVSEILGDMDLDFMRDENALGSGAGFAFGTAMQVGTGRLKFLMFYGEFNAGLGFDIMLKDYGDAQCVGRSGPIGINGWYASGQAWAYIMGRIGIRVNMKFIDGNFDILKIGAAAVLQAKLPNPVYMRGVVGGEFSILGGLVSGNCRFKFTLGEKCEILGVSETTGVKVITDVTPDEEEDEVSVFTTPQVAFALTLDESHDILNNDNQLQSYRVKLDYFKVTNQGQEVPGEIVWNTRKDVAMFKSYEILPPEADLTVSVKVLWEEKSGGVWKPLGGNQQEYETEERHFTTGTAPGNIPEENVLYTYPVKGQYHYHQDEYDGNYITLKSGQAYLFEEEDESGASWDYLARIYSVQSSEVYDLPVTYTANNAAAGGEVHWDAPGQLQPETVYTLRVIKVPAGDAEVDSNVSYGSESVYNDDGEDGSSVEVANAKIESTLALAEDFVLYETNFRTSRYRTFTSRLDAVTGAQSIAVYIEGWNLVKLGYRFDSDELLDEAEHSGWKSAEPLVQLEAGTQNSWYSQSIYPPVYQYYPPANGVEVNSWKPADRPQGIPPLKAMSFYQENMTLSLGENEVTAATKSGTTYIAYDLEYYTYRDYHELTNKALNKYLDTNINQQPAGIRALLQSQYTNLISGAQYGFSIRYVLPGGKVTTRKNYFIEY